MVTTLEFTCFNAGVNSLETNGREVAGISTWPIHWVGQTFRNPRAFFFRTFASIYKTRVIPNNVCIVISTQFNLNCIFRIDLIHLQQKSLQEYVKTITCTRILNLNSVRKLRVSNKQLRIKFYYYYSIIDTTGTTHYGVGKFLSQLLQPLTINEHTVKDTFDAKSRIQTINQALFSQGYQYVSFDVESLFTNVPLERTL